MFRLEFKTDNAAFEGHQIHTEIANILREAADRIERGYTDGFVYDTNGNTVGEFDVHAKRGTVR